MELSLPGAKVPPMELSFPGANVPGSESSCYLWDDLITFLVNTEKLRDAAMRNTGTGFVVLSHHSLFVYFLL